MAPAFAEAAQGLSVPSKMFQHPLSDMAASINDLSQSGDFYYKSEPEATARRFADWRKHAMIGDLASVAAGWFRKSPRQMQSSISVVDQSDKSTTIPLVGHALQGAW